MKSCKLFYFILGLVLINTSLFAQESEGIKEEGAHQAEYNANAQDRDHSGEIDSRQAADAPGDGDSTGVGDQTNFGATVETVIITPAGTRTTSSSGSPGILMEDNSTTDGTNTRQSAQPNIAGSPVPDAAPAGKTKRQDSDVPDNKIFSGKEQKAVPMNAEDRENQDSQKQKKTTETDRMQKG